MSRASVKAAKKDEAVQRRCDFLKITGTSTEQRIKLRAKLKGHTWPSYLTEHKLHREWENYLQSKGINKTGQSFYTKKDLEAITADMEPLVVGGN